MPIGSSGVFRGGGGGGVERNSSEEEDMEVKQPALAIAAMAVPPGVAMAAVEEQQVEREMTFVNVLRGDEMGELKRREPRDPNQSSEVPRPGHLFLWQGEMIDHWYAGESVD